jgi:2-polyprenyl-3-methyl-5-hydroxy-6-metoxy-1,4-benzoquinol methylase
MKQWYEQLFENYGKTYDSVSYINGTAGECNFIESEAGYDKNMRILDIGCGTGRHCIEMARRGYRMTGIDLSDSMLAQARTKAAAENVDVVFIKMDATQITFNNEFDLVIMMCEGAFPLMETDELNFKILENAAKVLKSKGKLIFSTLNGLFPLFHSISDFMEENSEDDQFVYQGENFDLMTFRDKNIISVTDDDGNQIEMECNERYYVPSEITWMLKSLGFATIDIFGAPLGEFSRENKLKTSDYEMLVVAVKK